MNTVCRFLAAISTMLCANTAISQNRMPAIPPEKYDAEQGKAAAEFLAARKIPVFGPFEPLMRSPVFMNDARAMGDYLRYQSAIGLELSEFVILLVAREWTQDYEWYVHAPIALKQGIRQDVIDAIADGRRPENMSSDQALCYEFVTELNHYKRVSDTTYSKALQRFGEHGVIDLIGINGYYTMLAMTMNTTQMPIPADGKKLPRLPQ